MSVSLSHCRALVLVFLLTHVITKKSYEMDCSLWGERADWNDTVRSKDHSLVGTRYSLSQCFYWFFLFYWFAKRTQQLFFAALHQRCTALCKSYLSIVWLCVAILLHLYGSAPAAFRVATAALTQSQKCTTAANGKQRSCNLSAALIAALISP